MAALDEARAHLAKAREFLEAAEPSGPAGRDASTTFSRLLKLKSKAQYQSAPVSAADATKSRLLEAAQSAVPVERSR